MTFHSFVSLIAVSILCHFDNHSTPAPQTLQLCIVLPPTGSFVLDMSCGCQILQDFHRLPLFRAFLSFELNRFTAKQAIWVGSSHWAVPISNNYTFSLLTADGQTFIFAFFCNYAVGIPSIFFLEVINLHAFFRLKLKLTTLKNSTGKPI